MVVRIPAAVVAFGVALALNIGTFALTRIPLFTHLPIILLPMWAMCSGFIASRWSSRLAPVPGFSVGLLIVAVQIGLSWGYTPTLKEYVDIRLGLLQIIAALTGGLFGMLLTRRATEVTTTTETDTALSI